MPRPRLLCVAPTWLGDAVLARPAVACLGRAGAEVEVLSRGAVGRVLEDLTGVLRVHAAAGGRARFLAAAFGHRQGRHDAALVLPPSFSAALVARATGARRIVGWRGDTRSFLLHRAPPRPPHDVHLAMQYLELARSALDEVGLGSGAWRAEEAAAAMPRLAARVDEEAAAVELRRQRGFHARPYIVVAPGSRFGPAKRWPADRFAVAATDLARRLDAEVALAGDASDAAACAAVHAALPRAHDLAGQTNLAALLGLLAGATAVLANDSGVMHLAAALGRPTVGVFGSSNPAWTAPLGEAARFVVEPVRCSPCYARTCTEDFGCMLGIEPQRVVETLIALVSRAGGPSQPVPELPGRSG